MTEYLVDTNVISELEPSKHQPRQALLEWLEERSDALYLSVITPLEIQSGILKLGRLSPGRRHEAMAAWFRELDLRFASRMLPLTREVALIAARISDARRAQGHDPDWPDTIIAATANCYDKVLLTRNVRHFADLGIAVVDPFTTLPE